MNDDDHGLRFSLDVLRELESQGLEIAISPEHLDTLEHLNEKNDTIIKRYRDEMFFGSNHRLFINAKYSEIDKDSKCWEWLKQNNIGLSV